MKKRILSFVLAITILVAVLPTTAFAASFTSFRDVASTAWYHDAVDYVSRKGIMSGVGNNTFSPETTLTRAQLCQILYNIEKKPHTGSGSFSDVSASAWYSSAVNWAAAQGIVNGTGNGLFSPDNPISREQMVTILYRYATYKSYNLSVLVSLSDYSDANLLSSWAQDAMQWAVSEGIISGTTATTIAPQGTTTRAQAATMLMRFCQRMEAKEAFYAKDMDDFGGAEIINFDKSTETNFAVLVDKAVTVESKASANQLSQANEDEGIYVFTNIDQTISTLKPGDVFYVTYDNGPDDYLLLKVGSIEIDGSTATITEGKASLSDYFQYIDLDMDLDLSAADSGTNNTAAFYQSVTMPSFLAGAYDLQPANMSDKIVALLPGTTPTVLARDITGSTGLDFKAEFKGSTLSLTANAKLTLNVKVCYDKNIFDIEEISFSVKTVTKLEGKVSKNLTGESATYKKNLPEKPVSFPIATGVEADDIQAFFKFDAKAAADGTISGTITTESGTKYSGGKAQSIEKSDPDLSVDIEGNFNIECGVGVTGSIVIAKIFRLQLTGEAGIELNGTAEIIHADAQKDEKHLCLTCIDGDADLYFKIDCKPKIGLSKKYSVTLFDFKPVNAKIKFAEFYISVAGGDNLVEFGWGKCPHKAYLVTAVVTDQFGNRLTGATITVRNDHSVEAVAIGKTEADGMFKTYCENGNYRVSALSLDGHQDATKEVNISSKATTVMLEMKSDNAAPMSEVVVDMYTGMPQIRYYNDKGQVAYIIMMNSEWDDGAYDRMPLGYLQDMFAIAFSYDTNGKLLRSISTEVRGASSGCLFEDNLEYRYEGNLINAYDDNGKLRFSMNEHGNIVEQYSPYSDLHISTEYTYDNQGNVTAIKTDANETAWWFGRWFNSANAKVSYDAGGNVVAYSETIQCKDEDGKDHSEVRERKFFYENGVMTRFDDSDYSKWPWLISYDNNKQVSGLQIEDLDDGTHGGNYVYTRGGNEWPDYRSWYSLMDYRFSAETKNGKPQLTIEISLNSPYVDSEYKTVTIPSK